VKTFSIIYIASVASLALTLASVPLVAQSEVTCDPVSQRNGRELGCFIDARLELGALPRDTSLFWHIDEFENSVSADSARVGRGVVVESLGKIWLFTIADSTWRPHTGKRVALVGPLPLVAADSFAAVYMEGIFRPGMITFPHRHPGVEAWYTLEGEQCLETPEGKMIQKAAGPGLMVRGGLPMRLTGMGTDIRRSLVLILQDATKPRSVVANDWVPKNLCTPSL
jgi:hypothetical protein